VRVTTPEDLGNLVREKRRGLGLTQLQCARAAGVSRVWLVHVETGHPGAEFGKLLKLLAALDLSLDLVDRRGAAPTGTLLRDLLDEYEGR
jgi:HTH-type transcriptional regulator/antitoxin HipB